MKEVFEDKVGVESDKIQINIWPDIILDLGLDPGPDPDMESGHGYS